MHSMSQKLGEAIEKNRQVVRANAYQEQLDKLKSLSLKDDFWNNSSEAQSILKNINLLEGQVSDWDNVQATEEDLDILLELASEDKDESFTRDIEKALRLFRRTLEQYELHQLKLPACFFQ